MESSMMNEFVEVNGKKFFGTKYRTEEIYDGVHYKSIDKLKKLVEDRARFYKYDAISFFENEGVHFFLNTITEANGTLTFINQLQEGGCLSGGDIWKFGFVDKEGRIFLLYKGNYVARGRKEAIKFFRSVKIYVEHAYKGECIAFATKN